MRQPLSTMDQLIIQLDIALKSVAGGINTSKRPSPANTTENQLLTKDEAAESISILRVNHTGEVCAQALYQGQALTARSAQLRTTMRQASEEEIDHLAWCETRIRELNGRTSYLNPLWYLTSLVTGISAGMLGDRINLGFLAATEEQVCEHLEEYIDRLPEADNKSRAVLEQMKTDEAGHARTALEAGGVDFSTRFKKLMRRVSRIMTWSTYRI
jgi:ubiquinone biosynthesis monooxygenase Coq7